jgi:hypothetical protein
MDDTKLLKWFELYDADFWFELSQDKDLTYPNERSLLYSIGNLANRKCIPSEKQPILWN